MDTQIVSPVVVSFLNGVIVYLLPLLLASLAGYIGVKIVAVIIDFRRNAGEDKNSRLYEIVRQAVIIAEQTGLAQELTGALKKAVAIDWVKAELKRLGWGNIDVDKIAGLIEYYVYQTFTQAKEEWERPATLPVQPCYPAITLPAWAEPPATSVGSGTSPAG